MGDSFGARLKNAWNAFFDRDGPKDVKPIYYGSSYSTRPDRVRLRYGNEKTIAAAIYNRIAIDVSSIGIQHARLDENGRYIHSMKTGLNDCLTVEANIDQTPRALMQDVVLSMFDEGCVAIVPVDTISNPLLTDSYDIRSLRSGKIVQWYPEHVKILLYNDRIGQKEEIILPKKTVCIVENPLYSVINEPNSVMKRLIHKLALLDAIDEQSSAGKLDLIIQLPYVVKNDVRKSEAEKRRKEIEDQLVNTKYGIAYTDGTEKITQLNRPIENNLMNQIEYLTTMLYSQLGLSKEILEGTANEVQMLNYNNRTIEPIISSIVNEMNRKFLTKTARSQGQSIVFFKDPFRLVPVNNIADIADKFTRNEIMTSNEIRQIIGMKPSEDPEADTLRNKNLNQSQNPSTAEADKGVDVSDVENNLGKESDTDAEEV